MKVTPIAKTIACSTGAVLTFAGLYTYSAEKLLDYMDVEDAAVRDVALGLSALSIMTFVAITRVCALWNHFSKQSNSMAQESEDSWSIMLLKAIIIANVVFITPLFGYLSADSLLGLVGESDLVVISFVGAYVAFSSIASYLAFIYGQIIVPNIALIGQFFSDLQEGDNHRFNRRAALSAVVLSSLAIVAHTIFMNFAIKGALEVFPIFKEVVDTTSREIIAGILAITNVPTLALSYVMQAYRFFDPQRKSIALKGKSTCLTCSSYLLLVLTGLVFLSIYAGGAYISMVDVINQAGFDIGGPMTQVLAIVSAMSVFFSDYVLTYRAVEGHVVRWLNDYYDSAHNNSTYDPLLGVGDFFESSENAGMSNGSEEDSALNGVEAGEPIVVSSASSSNWASFYGVISGASDQVKKLFTFSPHGSVG